MAAPFFPNIQWKILLANIRRTAFENTEDQLAKAPRLWQLIESQSQTEKNMEIAAGAQDLDPDKLAEVFASSSAQFDPMGKE